MIKKSTLKTGLFGSHQKSWSRRKKTTKKTVVKKEIQ